MQRNQIHVSKTAHLLVLPYTGLKTKKTNNLNEKNNSLKCMLLENITTRVTYSGTRLSRKFTNLKGKTEKEHRHDIVY